ncbi:MAG: hypothetical protein ACFB50_11900 [Rubrobacteraceae bacterium]
MTLRDPSEARTAMHCPAPTLPGVVKLNGRGRRYVEMFALDATLRDEWGGKVARGAAKKDEPDEALRRKIRLYMKVQASREDAVLTKGGSIDDHRGDVPARMSLGGIQVFTAGREKDTHKRPKGYAPWRPQKKTVRLIWQVKEVLEEYRSYLPMTARQIFYRLVGAYGYQKSEAAYGRLTEHLGRARRARMISFEDIRDDGISVMAHEHYAGESAFYGRMHEMAAAYKRDKLANQKLDMRVYCEAAGMIPQLDRVCEPYSVPVYSCSGFDSISAKHELNKRCWQSFTYRGRKTVILHLGDFDPSGESIFNDGLVEDIHAFLREDVPHKEPEEVAVFERVALRAEHVERFRLPTAPPKDSDSRTKNWEGKAACQLEALPPDMLGSLVDATIKSYLNLAVLEKDREAEAEERRRIAKALPAAGGAASTS